MSIRHRLSGNRRTTREPPGRGSVVHVVEAYGGGVAAAISDYVENAPTHEHALVYAERLDALVTPRAEDLFVWRQAMREGHARRIRDLRATMRRATPGTMFHAHSSIGGVYVRLAALGSSHVRTAYTPHCYGFERRDWPRGLLLATYVVEKVLSRLSPTTVTAACSPRELRLARRLRPGSPGVFVPNIAPMPAGPAPLQRPAATRPVLVAAGRLSPQKDPRYLVGCVAALRRAGVAVDARWLGDGDADLRRELEAAGIAVSGWLERTDLTAMLGEADVYLHTGLWEGFPITVLEALAAGTPVLVRDIPSMQGYDFATTLGAPDEVVTALAQLQGDDEAWAATVRQGADMLERCSRPRQVEALRELYG